jgi:flagellar hook-associated protein 1 FlgK
MSGLYATLDNSVASLSAQSVAINITGKNLANVNSTTYADETVNFGNMGTVDTMNGPETTGIATASVESLRNALLDSQVREADSQASYYTTQQSAYQQAQAALGQSVSSTTGTSSSTPSTDGISSALDGFFNAFQGFAANPTGAGEQQTVMQAASVLTNQLQSTDANLAQVQSGLTTQVGSTVTSTNTLLSQVATLNQQICAIESGAPGTAVDLRDQREADLEQIASNIPITVTEGTTGMDTVTAQSASGPVTLVSGASVTGPITFDGTSQISAGSPATVLTPASGAIQGAIAAATGGVQTLRDNLDNLANQIVTSVNGVYNPSGTGTNFFDPSGTTAGTIAVDSGLTASNLSAGNGSAAGDNSVALAVANLANNKFSSSSGDAIDGTFDSYYANTVSGFGQTFAGVNSQATDETNIQTLATTQRSSVSGVNLDEEMSNLLMYQRSYQASAQVFQTVDSLMDTVINSLGTLTT